MSTPNFNQIPVPFGRCGFYLHSCWLFGHPFAIRRWEQRDFTAMFELLRAMRYDTVMLWPPTDLIPDPVSESDAVALHAHRNVIDDAHRVGLQCWIVQTAGVTVPQTITTRPLAERHLYPFMRSVNLENETERQAHLVHRQALQSLLNNADAYVTIDGDPGGYPDARPERLIELLEADRAHLNKVGTHPTGQEVIPWLWAGWGNHWDSRGPWQEPLEPLTRPVLRLLKQRMPASLTLLPGRSAQDTHANGRTNFALVEQEQLLANSWLLFYEIVEFEPVQPCFLLQFDLIREVVRREQRLAAAAHGAMANAQQPVTALPNIYFFSRIAHDPHYLETPDAQVLSDLAHFLGGPPEILSRGWNCLAAELAELPADLPARIREIPQPGDTMELIPGGARRYLEILAQFVASRGNVLRACARSGRTAAEQSAVMAAALQALVEWWNVHRYVGSGTQGEQFRLAFTHPRLLEPLRVWLQANAPIHPDTPRDMVRRLVDQGVLETATAETCVADLLPTEKSQ